MKQKTAFLTAGLFIASWAFSANLWAVQKIELIDEDGDGKKETQVFWEGGKKVKVLSDKNNDGKSDIFMKFNNGKRTSAELDKDFDGKIDSWTIYGPDEQTKRRARDSNKDGKPDVYFEMLPDGTILKEYDRNFDGKIDKRALQVFNQDKKAPIYTNRLEYISIPGYDTIWMEDDSNFDGKIDAYREKGNKEAGKDKIGKPIDTTTAASKDRGEAVGVAQPSKESGKSGKSHDQKKIDQMNARFGY